MTYEDGRIAGRLLSPLAGRGTARGAGHFAPPLDFSTRGIYNEASAGIVGSSWSGF
jgi:hypothetical protein